MTVESEFRQVLAEFELISHGATVSWDASGHGKAGSKPPTGWSPVKGESEPPHVYWAERWSLEPVSGRVALLADAREALRCWKVRVAPAEGDGTSEDDWILKDGRGFTPDDVARRFNTTASRVRNLRKGKKLDTETGFKRDGPPVSDEQRIRNLVEQGCTERQIAFQVGVSKSTVRRALGRAA